MLSIMSEKISPRLKLKISRKRAKLQLERCLSLATAPWRVLPDFLVIGAHKAGTTSFYEYLRQHPMILSAWKKDIKYFDLHYLRGSLWYRSYFPTRYRMRVDRHSGQRYLTGDGATDYLFYPEAAARVAKLLPDVRLILVLRNPVDRAYSHYQHNCRNGWESLTFDEAVALNLSGAESVRDSLSQQALTRRYGYLEKGYYIEHLENWMRYFPRERIHIIRSEDFFSERALDVYSQVQEFLGLPLWIKINFGNANPGNYESMKLQTRQKLTQHFEPYNRALYQWLNRDLAWV